MLLKRHPLSLIFFKDSRMHLLAPLRLHSCEGVGRRINTYPVEPTTNQRRCCDVSGGCGWSSVFSSKSRSFGCQISLATTTTTHAHLYTFIFHYLRLFRPLNRCVWVVTHQRTHTDAPAGWHYTPLISGTVRLPGRLATKDGVKRRRSGGVAALTSLPENDMIAEAAVTSRRINKRWK